MSVTSYKKLLFSTEYIPLLAIIAVAAFLRFYNLSGTSLSNDELSAISRLRFDNFNDLIWKGVAIDGHPAGVQVFLYFFTKIAGFNDFLLRAPFAWWGLFTVIVCFAWCKLWFGKWPAYFTASSVAFLQFPIFYSQLARPYSPGLLFCMLILYHFTRLIINKNQERRWLYWLRYIAFSVLCCYVHYFSFMFAMLVALSGFFILPKSEKRSHIIACIVIALLCLPHLPVYTAQMQIGGLMWLGKPGLDFLPRYLFYVANQSWLVVAAALILILLSVIYTSRKKYFNRFHAFGLYLFLLTFIIGFLKSYFGKPVLQFSVLIFVFPLLPALLFSRMGKLKVSEAVKYAILGIWCTVLLFSHIIEKKYYSTEQYAQFKPLAVAIKNWNNTYGHNNIQYAVNIYNPKYIQYYLQDADDTASIKLYRCNNSILLDSLFHIIQQSNTLFFGYGWSNIQNPPQAEEIIRLKYGDTKAQSLHFDSGIKLYEKTRKDLIPRLVLKDSANKNLLEIPYIPALKNALLRVEAEVTLTEISPEIDIVASIHSGENITYWSANPVNSYFEGEQKKARIVWITKLPDATAPDETLKIYFWNRSTAGLHVSNYAAQLY